MKSWLSHEILNIEIPLCSAMDLLGQAFPNLYPRSLMQTCETSVGRPRQVSGITHLHCPSPQFGSSWSCRSLLPEASEIARADILEHRTKPLQQNFSLMFMNFSKRSYGIVELQLDITLFHKMNYYHEIWKTLLASNIQLENDNLQTKSWKAS